MKKSKTKLSELDRTIILCFADCNLNASEVARRLHYNRNTIEYHLQSIHQITGLYPKNFYDFVQLYEMITE